jgi:hypothetical protein
MFWLYLLGTVTVLLIALRRVVSREKTLTDQLFLQTVAFEHAQSGIAWIEKDGRIATMNAALAFTLGVDPKDARASNWMQLFAARDLFHLEDAYSKMLLAGQANVEVDARNSLAGKRSIKARPTLELLLVAVHDHKMRFVGHHCLLADRTRERALEAEITELRSMEIRRLEERALPPKTQLAPRAYGRARHADFDGDLKEARERFALSRVTVR